MKPKTAIKQLENDNISGVHELLRLQVLKNIKGLKTMKGHHLTTSCSQVMASLVFHKCPATLAEAAVKISANCIALSLGKSTPYQIYI